MEGFLLHASYDWYEMPENKNIFTFFLIKIQYIKGQLIAA